MQYPDDGKGVREIQIEMNQQSIIIRMEVFEGVLSETRFEGADIYYKMLNHLKSMCVGENIHAILRIKEQN